MCGRMNITDDPLALWISENLGINFRSQANHDFRPTQSTRLISADLAVHDSNWGIHPNWSDKIIINARSETLLSKPLFANHFKRRVLVPCSDGTSGVIHHRENRKPYSHPMMTRSF